MNQKRTRDIYNPLESKVAAGIMGLAVGDAIGVPVEFIDRETRDRDPVIDFREFGTFMQPLGTWSDDTSLTLCLLDSLSDGLDYKDIMDKFQKWGDTGSYTPFGEAFDMGRTTTNSIVKYKLGVAPLLCGGDQESDNGNGSLMRILPAVFLLYRKSGTDIMNNADMDILHKISGLTHRHPRSLVACGIYAAAAVRLMDGEPIRKAVEHGVRAAFDYYRKKPVFAVELKHFERLIPLADFIKISREDIKSGGYVVDSIEAAFWCLLTTKTYRNCILKAVNLGEDTDTTAAICGGLAGIHYGYAAVGDMGSRLVKNEYILSLCEKFDFRSF